MVLTMTTAVRGGAETRRYRLAGVHLLGLVAGSLILALVAVALGRLVPSIAYVAAVVSGLAAIWALSRLIGRPLPVPSSPAQVPWSWSYTLKPSQYAFAYGLGLGTAVFTQIGSSTFYVFLAACVAAGHLGVAAASAAVYAVMRSVPVFLGLKWLPGDDDPPDAALHRLDPLRDKAYPADALVGLVTGVGVLMVIVT